MKQLRKGKEGAASLGMVQMVSPTWLTLMDHPNHVRSQHPWDGANGFTYMVYSYGPSQPCQELA